MDQEYKQFTQELRLASNDDAASFRWIVGAYYFQEDANCSRRTSASAPTAFPGAHPSAVGITPPSLFDVIPNPYGNTVSFSIADLEDRSYSAYGQTDFELTEQTDSHGRPALHARQQGAIRRTTPARSTRPAWNPATYYDEALIRHWPQACRRACRRPILPTFRSSAARTSNTQPAGSRHRPGRRQGRPAVPRDRRLHALRQLLARLQVRQVRRRVPAHGRHAVPAAPARSGNPQRVRGRLQVDARTTRCC